MIKLLDHDNAPLLSLLGYRSDRLHDLLILESLDLLPHSRCQWQDAPTRSRVVQRRSVWEAFENNKGEVIGGLKMYKNTHIVFRYPLKGCWV